MALRLGLGADGDGLGAVEGEGVGVGEAVVDGGAVLLEIAGEGVLGAGLSAGAQPISRTTSAAAVVLAMGVTQQGYSDAVCSVAGDPGGVDRAVATRVPKRSTYGWAIRPWRPRSARC